MHGTHHVRGSHRARGTHSVSNQDLKHFSKSDLPGFAGAVCTNLSLQKAPAGRLNHEAYNTEQFT